MHPHFWKYFAIVSIVLCIIAGASLWAYIASKGGSEPVVTNTLVSPKSTDDDKETTKQDQDPIDTTKKLSIFAAGDIMLDRTMLLLAQKNNDFGYAFRMISSTLKNADIRIANLEGPITTNKSTANIVNGGRGLNFTFSPQVTTTLKENFDILSLANNHTTNFGFEGLEQTKYFLDGAEIAWFGDPNNREGQKLSEIIEKNGITVGFVGYHQLVEQGFEHVIAEIRRIRPEVDLLVAYPHWGFEYVTSTPSPLQKKEAHEMIDAGVDIIIGTHPHVIQPIEMYTGKIIFYSLGNFVFDQYFSLETMQGLLLKLEIEKNSEAVSGNIHLMPVHINTQSQPFVADFEEREKVLNGLADVSLVDDPVREGIRAGSLEFQFPLTTVK